MADKCRRLRDLSHDDHPPVVLTFVFPDSSGEDEYLKPETLRRRRSPGHRWFRPEVPKACVGGYKVMEKDLLREKRREIVDATRMFFTVVFQFSEEELVARHPSIGLLANGKSIEACVKWLKSVDYNPSTKKKRLDYLSSALTWIMEAHATKKLGHLLNPIKACAGTGMLTQYV